MKRMIALAIGIGSADPLPYLRGAINGAHDFHVWAGKLGYEAELLTDEKDPVTIEILRAKLQTMLTRDTAPIQRLVLYFAGHGLIREVEEGLWLLSDWNKELRAVAVEVLRRRLYMYGIEQIAIFADACRSLPADVNAADLTADAVLGRGPIRAQTAPAIDKFIAAQDGSAAFMLPGKSPSEDRCLFSSVLMEGLWGTQPSAYSQFFPGKVTSQSLGMYLAAEVPKRAETYKRKLYPSVQPLFPLGSDVYFGDQEPRPAPPEFLPWPDPNWVLGMGAAPSASASLGIGSVLAGLLKNAPAGFTRLTGLTSSLASPSLPSERLEGLEGIFDELTSQIPPPPPPAPRAYPGAHKLNRTRLDPGTRLLSRIQDQQIPIDFETHAGFAVEGEQVKAVWTEHDCFAESSAESSWWQVGKKDEYFPVLEWSSPALIELTNGLFLATVVLPQFIGSVVCDERGASALVYRPVGGETIGDVAAGDVAAQAIARMESGSLRADEIADLAVALRQHKHADPTLGVISAYLYDSMGDVESIRRMATYYVQHAQAIPYDIALLAQVDMKRDEFGWRYVEIPAVAAREARTEAEQRFAWTYSATPAARGAIAGFWPWMRQGWAFLDDPGDVELALIDPRVTALRPRLTSARFSTLDEQGGQELAELFGLAPQARR